MKRLFTSAVAALLAVTAFSQNPNTVLRPEQTVLLYAEEASSLQDPVQGKIVSAGFTASHDNGLTADETYNDWGDIRNISRYARFDLYLPRQCNGELVLVLPGGGYGYVSAFNEGIYAAEWLIRRGIAAAVVKYRLPNGHYEVPIEDVHRTMDYCRAHAAEWGVRKIGIMGGSAGGHLAAWAAVYYQEGSRRPDFSILLYPVITLEAGDTHGGSMRHLTGGDARLIQDLSLQKKVTAQTPPTFIALSDNDKVVPTLNSVYYYEALKKNGVPAEVHIYSTGGHGWGFYSSEYGKDRLGDEYRYLFSRSLDLFLKKQN